MQAKDYSPVWQEKFRVRSFDLGLNWKMRMSSLCSYFQEVAGRHATHLDMGYKFVQESGMAWVLSRLFIKILRMPEWDQEITLNTWPLGNERFFYRREYTVHHDREQLVNATSYWILLDLETRKPVVIPLHEDVLKANAGRHSMEMPTTGFPPVLSAEEEIHRVRYSDLDQNRHVNNARYVEWIFDLLPPEVIEKQTPSFFSIEYKHEVKAGDTVLLRKDDLEVEPAAYALEGCLSGTRQVCMRSKVIF